MAEPIISSLDLRAYIASVIGAVRQPFGQKTSVSFPGATTRCVELVQNSTRDRVIAVTVSRADVIGGVTVNGAIFSQHTGGASSSDFTVAFAAASQFRFILKPGESLSLQAPGNLPAIPMTVVTAQETY